MAHWKERFTYSKTSFVEQEVNGLKMRFYPNRIGLLTELAEISKPIAHAMATLFSDGRGDATSISENHKDKPRKDPKSGVETAEFSVDRITVEAVKPEMAEHRRTERNQAIDELIDGLMDTRNRILFGKLLMDSMRDEFVYHKNRDGSEVEEFLFGDGESYHGIDVPMLSQMVTGWLKANAKVFGNVGEKVTALVRGKLEILQSPSTSEETTNTVGGSSSKTPSSERSDSDSALTGSNS